MAGDASGPLGRRRVYLLQVLRHKRRELLRVRGLRDSQVGAAVGCGLGSPVACLQLHLQPPHSPTPASGIITGLRDACRHARLPLKEAAWESAFQNSIACHSFAELDCALSGNRTLTACDRALSPVATPLTPGHPQGAGACRVVAAAAEHPADQQSRAERPAGALPHTLRGVPDNVDQVKSGSLAIVDSGAEF